MRFKTEPRAHQMRVLKRALDRPAFGVFHEPGLGKTKTTIDTATNLFDDKALTGVVVVSVNGVHHQWMERELPKHHIEDVPYLTHAWDADDKSSEYKESARKIVSRTDGNLHWLFLNYHSLNLKRGEALFNEFADNHKMLCVLDESHLIKNAKAGWTKSLIAKRERARFRRLLTGTPINRDVLSLYCQMYFLDPRILEPHNNFKRTLSSSHWLWTHQYATYQRKSGNGRSFEVLDKVLPGALEEVRGLIAPHVDFQDKESALDLPPKEYVPHTIKLTNEQRRMYEGLKKNIDFDMPTRSTNVLMQQHQICGGFVGKPSDSALPSLVTSYIFNPNPKLDRLMAILEDLNDRAIIWCWYNVEIEAVAEALRKKFGRDSVLTYYGKTKKEERTLARAEFSGEGNVRFLVANPASGGTGFDMLGASTAIYYSSPWSYILRKQSEDRIHRDGQVKNVTIHDLICEKTVDGRILDTLKSGRDVEAAFYAEPRKFEEDVNY